VRVLSDGVVGGRNPAGAQDRMVISTLEQPAGPWRPVGAAQQQQNPVADSMVTSARTLPSR